MRWLAIGAALGLAACGRTDSPEAFDVRDPETAPHHGTRAGHMVHETELSLRVNDRLDYASKIESRLDSVEQWAATVQQDAAQGLAPITPALMREVEGVLQDTAAARGRLQEVNAIPADDSRRWRQEGQELHEEVGRIELDARRIGAQRGRMHDLSATP